MLLLADTAVLSVQESSDSINFIYDYSGRLTLFKNDPSVIVYDGLKCFIIDSARVKIARENRMIRKYYYDKPSTHDEERSIFILEDYGLILEVGEAWGQYLVFERIEQDGLEIRQKILEDSNGFFKFPKK